MSEKAAVKANKITDNSRSTVFTLNQTQNFSLPRPLSPPHEKILFLQRTIGNRAIQRLIETGKIHTVLQKNLCHRI